MDEADIALLRCRMLGLLRRDSHQQGEFYRIRSMYLDDPRSNGLFQNEEGMDNRLKLRFRFYDDNIDHLLLEVKEKIHGKTVKDQCRVTLEQYRNFMAGIPPVVTADTPRPLALLAIRMRTELLRPAVIVEYDRDAYVYPFGNTRITFDTNISASLDFEHFLDHRIPLDPVLPPGQHLIEVKFDDYLPGEVAKLLENGHMCREAFSKYATCRIALFEKGCLPQDPSKIYKKV